MSYAHSHESQSLRLKHLYQKAKSIAANANSLSITACEAMARIYDWWAWPYSEFSLGFYAFIDSFQGDLVRVLSGMSGLNTRDHTYYLGQHAFGRATGQKGDTGDTGFKKEFRDGSNQSAHATGAIYASHVMGAVAMLHPWLRPDDPPDRRLNNASIWLGLRLDILIQTNAIGKAIRDELGDPSEVGPYTGHRIPYID